MTTPVSVSSLAAFTVAVVSACSPDPASGDSSTPDSIRDAVPVNAAPQGPADCSRGESRFDGQHLRTQETELMQCIRNGHTALALELINASTDLSHETPSGETAMTFAIRGRSVIDLAEELGDADVIQLLQSDLDSNEVNLGRLASTVVDASGVNGGSPLSRPIYGVASLFDAGSNMINNINYDYWSSDQSECQWVRVKYADPVTLTRAVIHNPVVRSSAGSHLPRLTAIGTRVGNAAELDFLVIPMDGDTLRFEFPQPVRNVTETVVSFLDNARFQMQLSEIELWGSPSTGTDVTPSRPTVSDSVEAAAWEYTCPTYLLDQLGATTPSGRVVQVVEIESGRDNSIVFQWEDSNDWHVRALDSFASRGIDIDTVNADNVADVPFARRVNDSYYEILFTYPLDSTAVASDFFLVSTQGVVDVEPIRFDGEVQITKARGRGTRPRKEYRGFPVGSIAPIASPNGLEVGLIFDAHQTVVSTIVDSPLVSMSTSDGKIQLDYLADGGVLRYTHDEVNVGLGDEQFDAVQFGGGYSMRFSPSGAMYLFVWWSAESMCPEFHALLEVTDNTLRPVNLQRRCDV